MKIVSVPLLHSSSFTLPSRRRTNKFISTFPQKHVSVSSPGILLSLGNILFFLHFQNTLSLQPKWNFSASLPWVVILWLSMFGIQLHGTHEKRNSACLLSLFSFPSSWSKRININNHHWAWPSQNFAAFPDPANHSMTGSEFSIPWLLQQGTAIKSSRAHFP